jgi:hypothetical protein
VAFSERSEERLGGGCLRLSRVYENRGVYRVYSKAPFLRVLYRVYRVFTLFRGGSVQSGGCGAITCWPPNASYNH